MTAVTLALRDDRPVCIQCLLEVGSALLTAGAEVLTELRCILSLTDQPCCYCADSILHWLIHSGYWLNNM